MSWIGATYRSDVVGEPEISVALNDVAWFGFLIGWVMLALQMAATAAINRQERFGTLGGFGRLPLGQEFLVVRGRPSERLQPFLLLFGGIALALLAWPVAARWHTGRLRPATPATG